MKTKIDERLPKEILKQEIYLDVSMVRKIVNCGYNKALEIMKKAIELEKKQESFVVNQKTLIIKTKTLKKMLGIR